MHSFHIVAVFALAQIAARVHGLNATQDLFPRQTDAITIPFVNCDAADSPVKACGESDLTPANWAAFEIDNFLVQFLTTFGQSGQFPSFFYQQQLPPDTPSRLDCSTIDSQGCFLPSRLNPDSNTDCAFASLGAGATACHAFLSPQAGFVARNYINLWTGVVNNFRAVDDAGNAILSTNFVDEVVDALKEREGNLFLTIVEAIASIAISFLPFGGAFKVGVKLFKAIDTVLKVAGDQGIRTNSLDVIQVAVADENIRDLADRTKDQMKRQIQNIVTGTQQQMQNTLDAVFGSQDDNGQALPSEEQARNSRAFQFASSGAFLNPVPSRQELAVNMERNLKNWVVSSTIQAMNWEMFIETRELLDDPAKPGGVCRDGFGGTIQFSECAFFSRNRRQGPFANGLSRIQDQVDLKAAFNNAQECQNTGGGNVDWGSIADEIDKGDENGLPRCFYNFKVTFLY
jgi:hypothetical protein